MDRCGDGLARNAHLANGYDRVVVLAPMPSSGPTVPSAQDDVDELNRTARAVLLTPDAESLAAFGPNPYDPRRAAAAGEAGHIQGRAFADQVAALLQDAG
jgi:NTE family protein